MEMKESRKVYGRLLQWIEKDWDKVNEKLFRIQFPCGRGEKQ